ncbi:MAG: hypothetical protein A2987_04505 [Omnitrophica bacterium RIFCSPLOWO2_01_FULL_45_10]|nr:MAG: hypothetical protein A2987_04505 [Omnitrophica bacterium RIFCSPLOWO2_01_FULL_45_10]
MKKIIFILAAIFAAIGCGRVQVVAPKEPIKVDVAMRLDVYQHVVKDIDAVEDVVSGKKSAMPQSRIPSFLGVAYAEEGLSPEAEEAVMGRKSRYQGLISAESSGRIGETRLGFVEVRGAGEGDQSLKDLVAEENSDRMIIYKSITAKNNAALFEVQKVYAEKLQSGAPSGTPIESASGEWRTK